MYILYTCLKGTKVDKSKRKKIGRRKLLGISGGGSEDKKEKLFLFGRPTISLEIGKRGGGGAPAIGQLPRMNRPDQSELGRNSEKESQEESVVNGHLDRRAARVARVFCPWSERLCKKYRGLERGIGKGKSRPFDSSCLLDPGHLVCDLVRDLKRWFGLNWNKKKIGISIEACFYYIDMRRSSRLFFGFG